MTNTYRQIYAALASATYILGLWELLEAVKINNKNNANDWLTIVSTFALATAFVGVIIITADMTERQSEIVSSNESHDIEQGHSVTATGIGWITRSAIYVAQPAGLTYIAEPLAAGNLHLLTAGEEVIQYNDETLLSGSQSFI